MKNHTHNFTIALLIILSIIFIIYNAYHYDNIFQIFIYPILGLIFIYNYFKVFQKNKKQFLTKKNKNSFIQILILSFFIILIPVIIIHYENLQSKEKILKAQNFGAFLYFYSDGTYVIKSGPWASKKHFYGKYELKKDTIILDNNGLDDVITSEKLLMIKAKDLYNNTDSIKNYLVNIDTHNEQIKSRFMGIDKNKNEIYEPMFLEITFDKRNYKCR